MIRYVCVLLLVIINSVASIAISSDEQIQDYILYPYQTSVILQEDFFGGGTSNGTIGNLGMGTSGGTSLLLASEADRPGILRRDTGAGVGTLATTILYPHSSSLFSGNLPHNITWVVRLNNNDADTSLRIGAGNSTLADPPTDGIYFEKDEVDTNWFCITSLTGVRTATDSGVAVNTDFNTFMYKRFSGSVEFYLNGSLVCTNSTNLTTVRINPFTQIRNNVASNKTVDHDYFQIDVKGMTR